MTHTPLASVVVVTWNGRRHLAVCLDALAGQTLRDFEAIVVDNGSTDGSAAEVASAYPWVRLIHGARNLGFAAGNNLGIRSARAPYVATLNNDTAVDPAWLEALVDAAERDPSLGSVASKMVFAHDPSTINSCGIALDPAGIAWDLLGGYPADMVVRPRRIFGPCAGAALYRRIMLDDVGLFDEDYFAYLEDVDLAWRARLRGWESTLAPRAIVRHAHSGTLGEGSPLKRYLLARNKVWTVAKCAPDPDLWRRLPVITTYDAGAAAFGVARQRDWASLRGRLAALATLPDTLRKRQAIQARRAVSPADLEALYAPLAPPWDVPRRYRHLTSAPSRVAEPIRESSPTADGPTPPSADEAPSVNGLPEALVGSIEKPGRPVATGPRELPTREVVRRAALGAAGLLLRPRPSRHRPDVPGRVVVLRPDHLGDVLLSRPALELIRCALPDARLTVVVGPWGAPSLRGIDARIATFDFPGFTRAPKRSPLAPYAALLAFAARLRREQYDFAVILRPDHWWGALAAALAGIPLRVGHETPTTAPLLTHAVRGPARRRAAELALDVAELFLRAVGAGDRPVVPNRRPRFSPPLVAVDEIDAWLAQHISARGHRIAVHPGAGAALKTWPAQRWARVCEGLPPASSIIVTAGPGEEHLAREIAEASCRPVVLAPRWSWETLAALYARTDLVLGMDSGPLHLAEAVGAPTVRVYGPTDPEIYGPSGDPSRHRVIQARLGCVPCGDIVRPPCGHVVDPPCLAGASVRRVLEAASAFPAGAGTMAGDGDAATPVRAAERPE